MDPFLFPVNYGLGDTHAAKTTYLATNSWLLQLHTKIVILKDIPACVHEAPPTEPKVACL